MATRQSGSCLPHTPTKQQVETQSEVFWEGGLGTPLSGRAMLPHCLQFSPCSFPEAHLSRAIRHFDDELLDILTQLYILSIVPYSRFESNLRWTAKAKDVHHSCQDPNWTWTWPTDPPWLLPELWQSQSLFPGTKLWESVRPEPRWAMLGTREWCLCSWPLGYAEIWNPSDATVGQHLTKCWLTGSDGLEQTQQKYKQNLPSGLRTHWDHWDEMCLCHFMPSFQNRTWRSILGNHTCCMSCFSQSDDQLASVSGWMMVDVGWTYASPNTE